MTIAVPGVVSVRPRVVRYPLSASLALLICDSLILLSAIYIVSSLLARNWALPALVSRLTHGEFILVISWLTVFYCLGLYQRSFALSAKDEFYFALIAVALAAVVQFLLLTLIKSPLPFVTSMFIAVFSFFPAGASRALTFRLLEGFPRSSILKSNGRGFSQSTFRIGQLGVKLVKRSLDLTLAMGAFLVVLPIMVIAAAAIWIESGRPILFYQDRIGRSGEVFKIVKFRTMRPNVDNCWAVLNDSRITRVGSILRRTSIDELPQLFNVLLGNMSLVGPRPEMISFEHQFSATIPSYSRRRSVLPGITGWAQVNLKRNLSPHEVSQVLEFDLFYIEHWSVFFDCTILVKTAFEFLFHPGV